MTMTGETAELTEVEQRNLKSVADRHPSHRPAHSDQRAEHGDDARGKFLSDQFYWGTGAVLRQMGLMPSLATSQGTLGRGFLVPAERPSKNDGVSTLGSTDTDTGANVL